MKSNLKRLRNEAGYTLQQIGDMCRRSKAQMHELESDRANPTLKTAYAVSKVLSIPVEEIWPNEIEIVEETVTIRRIKE